MSNILIKSPAEIELMRNAGQLLAQAFAELDGFIKAGMSTMDINNFVEDYIVQTLHARPASKGQYGYQYVLNSSVKRRRLSWGAHSE